MWEEYWCCEEYRSTVDIGWEHHIWFDHNHIEFKVSTFKSLSYSIVWEHLILLEFQEKVLKVHV